MESDVSRGEFLASLIGGAVPGSLSLGFYYVEVKPLFDMLPATVTAETAYRLTAINSLLLFTGVFIWMTLKLMDAGSIIGRWIYWRSFQGGDVENE